MVENVGVQAMEHRFATVEDLDTLVSMRIEVLRAANKLSADADMSEIERQARAYYAQALQDGTHLAVLVYDGERLVGAGGVSFYRVMPTCHNPSGRKAYIMNMYTRPEYRRRGVARRTLDMLVRACHERGVDAISLEATDVGRPLYEKYGFVKMENEMELPGNA